jgi:crotonobetainyl-CoA:carnitine CoA-transferase CaiB-like acyl-CoA transferase
MPDLDAIRETMTGYVVVLKSRKGQFIATNGAQVPFVFATRAGALDFRDALWKVHKCGKGRVVKVRMTVESFSEEQ